MYHHNRLVNLSGDFQYDTFRYEHIKKVPKLKKNREISRKADELIDSLSDILEKLKTLNKRRDTCQRGKRK